MNYLGDYVYANSRLRDTVVRTAAGVLVYINVVRGDGTVQGNYVTNHRVYNGHVDKLNVDPIPLGYVNSGSVPVYIERVPKRRNWRQGLTLEVLEYKGGRLDHPYPLIQDFLVKNKYPSFEHCAQHGGAWCRKFAVKAGTLQYKGNQVGAVVDGVAILDQRHKYLQESLEETL